MIPIYHKKNSINSIQSSNVKGDANNKFALPLCCENWIMLKAPPLVITFNIYIFFVLFFWRLTAGHQNPCHSVPSNNINF